MDQWQLLFAKEMPSDKIKHLLSLLFIISSTLKHNPCAYKEAFCCYAYTKLNLIRNFFSIR